MLKITCIQIPPFSSYEGVLWTFASLEALNGRSNLLNYYVAMHPFIVLFALLRSKAIFVSCSNNFTLKILTPWLFYPEPNLKR